MATKCPISTISYNTEAFLKEKLDQWVSAHLIQCYMYIKHKGEDGDKDHIHLRVEPNKSLDPMFLSDQLLEYQKGHEKPLGVRPWRNSKEEDWYLYSVHDDAYLSLKYGGGYKGEKLPYEYTDIIVSENYDLESAWIRAKIALKHSSPSIAKAIKDGEKPIDLIMRGEAPHTVNAINVALKENDYNRLANEYAKALVRIEQLEEYILGLGIDLSNTM